MLYVGVRDRRPPENMQRGLVQLYNVTYVDGSSSGGDLAYETVALSPASPADTGIVFGCGDVFQDFDGMGVSGLLGLGQGPMSMVWQTQHNYGGSFAYCLPSRGGSAGAPHLRRRRDALQLKPNLTATFTPLVPNLPPMSSFYVVHIDDISVDGVGLPPIPGYAFVDGAIIDSGTLVTQLLPAAYYPMRDEFRRHMAGYTMLPERSDAGDGMDTCYNRDRARRREGATGGTPVWRRRGGRRRSVRDTARGGRLRILGGLLGVPAHDRETGRHHGHNR